MQPEQTPYQKKASALKQEVQHFLDSTNFDPPTGQYPVFISPSNSEYRANVYVSTNKNFSTAWNNASTKAESAIEDSQHPIKYLKCSIAYNLMTVKPDELAEFLQESTKNYFFYGIAFDTKFQTALLESECNTTDIYNYETGELDLGTINEYLSANGRNTLSQLPEKYILFQTYDWFCDENDQVVQLDYDTYNHGHRKVENVDETLVENITTSAAQYLIENMDQNTGKFDYAYFPITDERAINYNIVRHAGAPGMNKSPGP